MIRLTSRRPGAALAFIIKHCSMSTIPYVCFARSAIVEFIWIFRISIQAIRLSITESRPGLVCGSSGGCGGGCGTRFGCSRWRNWRNFWKAKSGLTSVLVSWQFLICYIVETESLPMSKSLCRWPMRGCLPWSQNSPAKSSRSKAQTKAPPNLFSFR